MKDEWGQCSTENIQNWNSGEFKHILLWDFKCPRMVQLSNTISVNMQIVYGERQLCQSY